MTTKTEKKRILVVDDTPSDTHLLKLYLEDTSHYVVREENDPRAAVSAALEFQPHLILLDVLMPGISGEVLAAHFQANPKLKTVPIVFLTCVVTKEQVDLCGGKIGRYPFLAKPIVLTEVGACVEKHLRA
jgi:DNA-binding response OmpR family regulator